MQHVQGTAHLQSHARRAYAFMSQHSSLLPSMAAELESAVVALMLLAGMPLPWLEPHAAAAVRMKPSSGRQKALYFQAKLAWLSGWPSPSPRCLANHAFQVLLSVFTSLSLMLIHFLLPASRYCSRALRHADTEACMLQAYCQKACVAGILLPCCSARHAETLGCLHRRMHNVHACLAKRLLAHMTNASKLRQSCTLQ